MNYQIHKGIVKIIQENIPERNCIGSIILTDNETKTGKRISFSLSFQKIWFIIGKDLDWYS